MPDMFFRANPGVHTLRADSHNPSRLDAGVQARKDRHNQSLPPEVRQSQRNQDWDHYLVGNEMAGPQFPLHERPGAVLPAVGHEIARPFISSSPMLVDALNKMFGTPDQPVWIANGSGAGGAAAEPPVDLAGAFRNLKMLYQGATEGTTPDEELTQGLVSQFKGTR